MSIKSDTVIKYYKLSLGLLGTVQEDRSCASTLRFLSATRSTVPITYGNVAVWVAGWLADWLAVCHSRYCIKTTKTILKLSGPSGSLIIEAFGTPYADTKFQVEPLHRGRLIHGGWEKLAIFNGYCRLSRIWCEIGRSMVTMER